MALLPKIPKVQVPAVTALPKVKTNIPPIAKPPKPAAAPKPATGAGVSLGPLYGTKRSRPTVQSVPTRTPSF